MGLDTSHNCWHGPYSSFMSFRKELAKVANIPDLDSMDGFGGTFPWDELRPDIIHVLLNHSDCDGQIDAVYCLPPALRLEELAPSLLDYGPVSHRVQAKRFATGLRLAAERGESVEFH